MFVQVTPPTERSSEIAHVVPAAPCNQHATLKHGHASTIKWTRSAHICLSPQPTFHSHYICDACPLEWDEYSHMEGPSFCPCCDAATEPYDTVDLREDAA